MLNPRNTAQIHRRNFTGRDPETAYSIYRCLMDDGAAVDHFDCHSLNQSLIASTCEYHKTRFRNTIPPTERRRNAHFLRCQPRDLVVSTRALSQQGVTLMRRPNSAFAFTFNHAAATATMALAALLTQRPSPAAKWTLFIQRIVGCSGQNASEQASLVAGTQRPADRNRKALSDKSDLRSNSFAHIRRPTGASDAVSLTCLVILFKNMRVCCSRTALPLSLRCHSFVILYFVFHVCTKSITY